MAWSASSYPLRAGSQGRSSFVRTQMYAESYSVKYKRNEIINASMENGKVSLNDCGQRTQSTVNLINRFFSNTAAPYSASLRKLEFGNGSQPGLRSRRQPVIVIKNNKKNTSVAMYNGRATLGLTSNMTYLLCRATHH